jgi:hypothetical protein
MVEMEEMEEVQLEQLEERVVVLVREVPED